MPYAEGTTVPVEKTKAELETLIVRKHRAAGYMSGFFGQNSGVQFILKNRILRFSVAYPDAKKFSLDKKGFTRKPDQIQAAVEAEERRLWRALLLNVRAKLEAVESGISTFDDEFMSNIVDPETGATVGETMRGRLAASYGSEKGKQLLLAGPTAS